MKGSVELWKYETMSSRSLVQETSGQSDGMRRTMLFESNCDNGRMEEETAPASLKIPQPAAPRVSDDPLPANKIQINKNLAFDRRRYETCYPLAPSILGSMEACHAVAVVPPQLHRKVSNVGVERAMRVSHGFLADMLIAWDGSCPSAKHSANIPRRFRGRPKSALPRLAMHPHF